MNDSCFGPIMTPDSAPFRLWAPAARDAAMVSDRTHKMARDDFGWFTAEVRADRAGTRYHLRIDDELDVPDPASTRAKKSSRYFRSLGHGTKVPSRNPARNSAVKRHVDKTANRWRPA